MLNLNYEYQLHIPVRFSNLPSNKLIVGELPEKLDIDIKTSGLKLLFIIFNNNNSELSIDFNTLKTNAKSQAYSISNGNFNFKNNINFDVEILKIRPDTLFFSQSDAFVRNLPVKLNIKTEMRKGYCVTSKYRISPSYISVSGDSAAISKMDSINTSVINLKDVYRNYSSTVLLLKSNPNTYYNLKEVQVNFNVDRLTETSIKLPVSILNSPHRKEIKLLPNYVTVTYLVSMQDYDLITPNSFKAIVNYRQIKEKQKAISVELIVKPSEVKVLKIEPPTLSYLIYK